MKYLFQNNSAQNLVLSRQVLNFLVVTAVTKFQVHTQLNYLATNNLVHS